MTMVSLRTGLTPADLAGLFGVSTGIPRGTRAPPPSPQSAMPDQPSEPAAGAACSPELRASLSSGATSIPFAMASVLVPNGSRSRHCVKRNLGSASWSSARVSSLSSSASPSASASSRVGSGWRCF
jgi:hypothetical protein